MNEQEDIISGFVVLYGAPNVGKSTLLNQIIGQKVAITSPRPQTTRNQIIGVLSRPDLQIVFMDTPGVMAEKSALNKIMISASVQSGADADLTFFMVDATKKRREADKYAFQRLGARGGPRYLLLNKIDICNKAELLTRIDELSRLADFDEIIPVSAQTGENVDTLIKLLREKLPKGPRFYPDDWVTDQPENFILAEFIREKAFLRLKNELPYSTAVIVEAIEERNNGVTAVIASLFVERQSQKGIIIGHKGEMLKSIGSAARKEMERRLGTKVFLDIAVKVREKWTDDRNRLRDFGYQPPGG